MDRGSIIKIGDEEYTLVLTTKSTKEIAKKYGGLESLGEKLMSSKKYEDSLDEVVWLITLLANQGIMIDNLKKGETRKLLKEEEVEILTSPVDLAAYKGAIIDAMHKGTKRNVESEENSEKNTQAG